MYGLMGAPKQRCQGCGLVYPTFSGDLVPVQVATRSGGIMTGWYECQAYCAGGDEVIPAGKAPAYLPQFQGRGR